MVVSDKHPLKGCPHIAPDVLERCEAELKQQYAEGKWLKRDLAEDALKWARSRAASMDVEDLPERIGGEILVSGGEKGLKLPYFTDFVEIFGPRITRTDGMELTRWEQVFILNHIAQGGRTIPAGKWMGFIQFPNTVSKVITMRSQVEEPLIARFAGKKDELLLRSAAIGGTELDQKEGAADVSMLFKPLPRIPVVLLFWDGIPGEEFEPQAKLMFDETVTEHLDIESIVFLSERIRQLLCGDPPKR
jgi:hypothetical protein